MRIILVVLLINLNVMAQENSDLPYNEIPSNNREYTAGTVAARVVDGLGFRFRWATEGLKTEDLNYKISEEGRTIEQTMDHVLSLSRVILNATLNKPNGGGVEIKGMSIDNKRREALFNFKKASEILKESSELDDFNLIFGTKKFPFWNAINGPIEDAVWHAGQIVAMRRASGNPIPKGINFMTGTVKR